MKSLKQRSLNEKAIVAEYNHMTTKIVFLIGQPREIILENGISNDPRLETVKELAAGVSDTFHELEKEYEARVFLLNEVWYLSCFKR